MSHPTPSAEVTVIGVGIDTARFGHQVAFLREDRQPAATPMALPETRQGYQRLQATLEKLHARHPQARFFVRIDAAGQYATNLESFLRALPLPITISSGEPERNKAYRQAHFPKRKSDAADSLANARYAVVERPPQDDPIPHEYRVLQAVVARLEAQTRQSTRLTNQLHALLAQAFPELDMLVPSLEAGYVLRMLALYPTARQIAKQDPASLARIPHMPPARAQAIHEAAADSVASLKGAVAQTLVRDLVRQLRRSLQAERKLRRLIDQAFEAIPHSPHTLLETIPGIGKTTAAILVAKIISIDRFQTPKQLVSYFGVFPEENSSGLTKDGKPHPRGAGKMSRRGNDLTRKALWHAAKAAARYNPTFKDFYRRQRAAGKPSGVILGHVMRKILHLVFAIWKSQKPYDLHKTKGPRAAIEDRASKDKRSPQPTTSVDNSPATIQTDSCPTSPLPPLEAGKSTAKPQADASKSAKRKTASTRRFSCHPQDASSTTGGHAQTTSAINTWPPVDEPQPSHLQPKEATTDNHGPDSP